MVLMVLWLVNLQYGVIFLYQLPGNKAIVYSALVCRLLYPISPTIQEGKGDESNSEAILVRLKQLA
jgi:hypothetical protein